MLGRTDAPGARALASRAQTLLLGELRGERSLSEVPVCCFPGSMRCPKHMHESVQGNLWQQPEEQCGVSYKAQCASPLLQLTQSIWLWVSVPACRFNHPYYSDRTLFIFHERQAGVKGLASDEPVLTLHVGHGSLVHLLLEC